MAFNLAHDAAFERAMKNAYGVEPPGADHMIELVQSDIFALDAEALVNPCNTEGCDGKGPSSGNSRSSFRECS